jgi:hypothetical protein
MVAFLGVPWMRVRFVDWLRLSILDGFADFVAELFCVLMKKPYFCGNYLFTVFDIQ